MPAILVQIQMPLRNGQYKIVLILLQVLLTRMLVHQFGELSDASTTLRRAHTCTV